ncbi:CoA protein activase [Desulfitobacterium sp.]|uniref:CoA protein activase n=1 Tax=Desulfitobacterium sp. TaxID=49981 RepID=UPI002CDAD63E|nr:CoA protein activase [Desulfitobacterium sp.]HVJ48391.1 CoA protein activase [Desulfitobacterium sp.]
MKVTFPHMGNSWIIIQALFESLGVEFVVPPFNSKQTLNIGTKLAPESACLPLKLNLGNYVEAAAQGADTVAITGGSGPCRFGYYGESERQILKDAGLNYDVVILELPEGRLLGLVERIHYLVGKKNSWASVIRAVYFAYRKSLAMDRIEVLIHGFRPRAQNPNEANQLYEEAKRRLVLAMTDEGVQGVVRWLQARIREKQAEHPESLAIQPLKIGLVGEIYTLLEPFTSCDVEKELGNLGTYVDRSIYLSGWVGQHLFQGLAQGYRPLKPYYHLAKPYLKHFVGGHGIETVGSAVHYARQGYDGIIQLLPLGCMPEIVASSILPRIQEDYNLPIMTLTFDEHTGQGGIQTRLEAFVDLLERSRDKKEETNRGGLIRA